MHDSPEQPKYGVVVLDRNMVVRNYTVILPDLFTATSSIRGRPVEAILRGMPSLDLRALANRAQQTGAVIEHTAQLDSKKSLSVTIHPLDGAQEDIGTIIVLAVDPSPMAGSPATPASAAITVEQQLNYDPLTGLLNHRGIEYRLRKEIKQNDFSGTPLIAVLADCDKLAHINESFGHAVGDVVLQEAARRIENSIRPTDAVARVRGDKFLILMPNTRLAEARHAAERLGAAVASTPFHVEGSSFSVSATFAVTLVSAETVSIEELLAGLQTVIKSGKFSGGPHVSTLGSPSDPDVRAPLINDVAKTLLQGDAFRVVLQTIRATRDESIFGYELLSRGPKGPLGKPLDFLRAATEHNILPSVDLGCIRRALRIVRRIGEGISCHINAMPSTLLQITPDGLGELFVDLPDRCRLCVEISEQQLIGEPSYLTRTVGVLRDLGIAVAIDDVGFGRSSLESLVVLSPDIIKIDRTFVSGISHNTTKRGFLKRLLQVANSLQAKTIAEGVEQAEELAVLRDLGVELAQGFYWERPLEVDEIHLARPAHTP